MDAEQKETLFFFKKKMGLGWLFYKVLVADHNAPHEQYNTQYVYISSLETVLSRHWE